MLTVFILARVSINIAWTHKYPAPLQQLFATITNEETDAQEQHKEEKLYAVSILPGRPASESGIYYMLIVDAEHVDPTILI